MYPCTWNCTIKEPIFTKYDNGKIYQKKSSHFIFHLDWTCLTVTITCEYNFKLAFKINRGLQNKTTFIEKTKTKENLHQVKIVSKVDLLYSFNVTL